MAPYGENVQNGGRKRTFSDANAQNGHAYQERPTSYHRSEYQSHRGGSFRGGRGGRGGFRGGYRGNNNRGYYQGNTHFNQGYQYNQYPPQTSTPQPPAAQPKSDPKTSKKGSGKSNKQSNGQKAERKIPTYNRPKGKIFFMGSLKDWQVQTSQIQNYYKQEIKYCKKWDLGKDLVQLQMEEEKLSENVKKQLTELGKKNVVMAVVFLNHGLTDPKLESF